MRTRDRWHDRIMQVEREYLAAVMAARLLEERLRVDPGHLRPLRIGTPDADRMQDRLEGTYLIRLFAVFEAGLREAWEVALLKPNEPPMRDLVNGVAPKTRRVTGDVLREVHVVRAYRNSLVHGGEVAAVTLADARRSLCRFFASLPEDW